MKRLNHKNIGFYERKRASMLKRLHRSGAFIDGSIVDIARVCGNKKCKCQKGKKHISKYLTYKDKRSRKTRTIYIPVDMVNEVKNWSDEYRIMKKFQEEICQVQRKIIRQYVKERKPKK